jgi:hypothetical protein
MPGKSKRKKLRYSSSNQSKGVQTPAANAAATTAPPPIAGTTTASKPQSTSVKPPPSASKAAGAQYTPDLLKHVGTELKISVALSAFILIVIIILYFVLH